MKKYIKRFREYRSILKNFFFLAVLQGSNFLIFLVLYPYLFIHLKAEKFGLVVLGQSIMSFFIILTDYSFNLQSTQKIAIARNDIPTIARVHSQTIYTKVILITIGFICWLLLVWLIPTFRTFSSFYILSYLFVIGQTLIPIWFFQGIEKFQYISILNISGKIIALLCILILIKKPEDYLWVNPILGLGNLAVAIFAFFFIQKSMKIRWIYSHIEDLKAILKDGWGIFFSSLITNIYMNINIIILKFIIQNDLLVGYYGVAEKIVGFMKQLVVIAAQAVYPRICQLSQEVLTFKVFIRNIFKVFALGSFIFCLLVFVLAEEVVFLFSQTNAPEAIICLKIMCFSPMLIAMNNPAYQSLIVFNHQKAYTSIIIIASVWCVLLNTILTPFVGIYGTTWSVISTEVLVMLGFNLALHYRYPQISFWYSTPLKIYDGKV